MKKFGLISCLVVLFIITYLLQVNLFDWFNIAGIKPNLFIMLVFFIGLFSGRGIGTTLGIFFGISLDFFIGKSIGISGIMMGVIGFLGGYLDRSFSKDSRITMITMIGMATLIYEIGTCILNTLINDVQMNIFYFVEILIIELIYNSIITIIIYPAIIKFGYLLEENFKENKILTRYF